MAANVPRARAPWLSGLPRSARLLARSKEADGHAFVGPALVGGGVEGECGLRVEQHGCPLVVLVRRPRREARVAGVALPCKCGPGVAHPGRQLVAVVLGPRDRPKTWTLSNTNGTSRPWGEPSVPPR